MPEQADISSTIAASVPILLLLALAGCGEKNSRSETTEFAEPTADVAECIARFGGGAEVWEGKPVRSSFVYDVSAMEGDRAERFFGGDPATMGSHSTTFAQGDTEAARADFLAKAPEEYTAIFEAGETILFRVVEGPGDFAEVLRAGCERLDRGGSLTQVTFSRDAS